MTKKELECWKNEGFNMDDLEDLINTEIEVGQYYRGFYKDGRVFVFACTEIGEDGDCIGNGFVNFEHDSDAIFCQVEDAVELIDDMLFDDYSKNPLSKFGYGGLSADWKTIHSYATKCVLHHRTYSTLKIEIRKESPDRVLIYTGKSDSIDIDHIIFSGVVEDENHLMGIMEAIDVESQIDVVCI